MAAGDLKEILLAPQEYCYLQKEGSGVVTVFVGPGAVNATQQDVPISYDSKTTKYSKRDLKEAVQQFPRVPEGSYMILENPAQDGTFPSVNTNQTAKTLNVGRREVISGPFCQPLWPGQSATVLSGHRLRTNQYLIAVIYNEEQAGVNWEKATVKVADEEKAKDSASGKKGLTRPESFAVGTRILIPGTLVSFYIPPTGVEILREEGTGDYVREAVTLERLEYCCLVDETGKKEYPKGPAVVFPRTTQVFEIDNRKRRKWKAVELNSINGLHLKVVASFEGEDITVPADNKGVRPLRQYTEGEELFITGESISIYYPREEFAIIQYGQGNKKHYSTTIPKGEGRYIIKRQSGEVLLKRGPVQLLPDPRTDIPVRRILSQEECSLWYPGNADAAAHNAELSAIMQNSPSGRSGLLSEGDFRKAMSNRRGGPTAAMNYLAPGASAVSMTDADLASEEFQPEAVGTEGGASGFMNRGSNVITERTITLNTKYDGVPRIEVWPGYAILIVGSQGARRVVEGPNVILLEYDEKLGHMSLSTGKPKSTDKLLKTVYLKVENNQVSDIIPFESKDHVKGSVKVSLRVTFQGETDEDRLRWFSTDNYVKYLCDHVRSVIAGMSKRHDIADVKSNYIDLVRDALLGAKPADGGERPGMQFSNGMKLNEVEVLELNLSDRDIAQMLDNQQKEVVKSDITLSTSRRQLEVTKQQERIKQEEAQSKHQTEKLQRDLERQTIEEKQILTILQITNAMDLYKQKLEEVQASEAIDTFKSTSHIERQTKVDLQKFESETSLQTLRLQGVKAETEAAVARFAAAKDGLFEVLTVLQRDDVATKMAAACNIERWLSGDSSGAAIANLLSMVPTMKQFMDKADSGSTNRLATASPTKR